MYVQLCNPKMENLPTKLEVLSNRHAPSRLKIVKPQEVFFRVPIPRTALQITFGKLTENKGRFRFTLYNIIKVKFW